MNRIQKLCEKMRAKLARRAPVVELPVEPGSELKQVSKASRFDWSAPLNAMSPLAIREMVTGQVPGWWARRSARRAIACMEEELKEDLALSTALSRAQLIASFPNMSQEDLRTQAEYGAHWFVRLKALERVNDESVLADIITGEKHRGVRMRAVRAFLEKPEALAVVLMSTTCYLTAQEAVRKIEDAGILRETLARLNLTNGDKRCMEPRILRKIESLEKADAKAAFATSEPAPGGEPVTA